MRRDEFLAAVSAAAMTSRLPSSPEVPGILPDLASEDLIPLFRARAQAVDAVVHGPMGRHGVPRAVAGIASGHGCRRFLAWDELPAAGVPAALMTAGLERIDHHVPPDRKVEHQVGYHDVDLGVTGSVAGLAESGTVLLVHGPGRPRMASLVPDVHVALLETGTIHRTLAHWAARYPGVPLETSNLVGVTGPSRTGDIELQLNLGVHGPRHVHVVLIR